MSIARSGVGWFVSSAGALAISWAASLYFPRALGSPQATLGLFYTFETIVSLATLISNGGVNGAMSKRISEGTNRGAYVGGGLLLTGGLLILVTLALVAASGWLSEYFGLGGLSVALIVGSVWLLQLRNTGSAILSGMSNVGRSGFVGFTTTAGQAVIQIALVFLGFGVVGLMVGNLGGAILATLVTLALVRINIDRPTREHIRKLVEYAKYDFLSSFAGKFYNNIDIIVISILIGEAATGVYGIGFRFALIMALFSGAVSRAVFPEISNHASRENMQRVKEIFADGLVLVPLLALPGLVGFAVLSKEIVVTFYTGAFAESVPIAVVAVAIQIPMSYRSLFGSLLSGLDYPELAFRSGVILIVTNLVLDLALVPSIGALGAIYASLAAVTLQMGYMGVKAFRLLDLSVRGMPFRPVGSEVVASLLMGGIVLWLKHALPLSVVPKLLVLIPAGAVAYFLIVLAISTEVRGLVLGVLRDLSLPTLN